MWQKRSTCVAVNAIMFAFLYLTVTFNKEYLRSAFAGNPILELLTGSYPNFIAAYVISLFPACPILTRRALISKGTRLIMATAAVVFVILTIEEFVSVFGASKVADGNDVVASALGVSCSILTFLILRRAVARRQPGAECQDVAGL